MKDLKASGLYRELKNIDLNNIINFSSNDYLGLSQNPTVIAKTIEALQKFGTGAGASRLISGNTPIHLELEKKLARFKKREAALVFSTGYMANQGIISALLDDKDTVIIDRLNHASIIDACHLTKAKLQVYPHQDMMALEKILSRSDKYTKRLIVTDSVFSMDGDIAPLPQIITLAKKYNAITMIDEAHATGTIGQTGKGAEEYFNIEGQIDIVMGTLSKALGSMGGFVAGKQELINLLINKSRSFIYSTALAPACCASAMAALEIIENEPQHLANLKQNIKLLSSIAPDSQTPIIPIIIGEADKTMTIAKQLLDKGLFVSGIRPPTVPKDMSRLRVTVSATHKKEDLECLLYSLQELIPA